MVRKGYKQTEEHRLKLIESHTGKKRSDKFKREQSERTSNFFKSEKGKKQIERLKIICKNPIVVHHINGNHFDDRPENRMLLTNSEHALLHILQGDIIPYGGSKIRRIRLKKKKDGGIIEDEI